MLTHKSVAWAIYIFFGGYKCIAANAKAAKIAFFNKKGFVAGIGFCTYGIAVGTGR